MKSAGREAIAVVFRNTVEVVRSVIVYKIGHQKQYIVFEVLGRLQMMEFAPSMSPHMSKSQGRQARGPEDHSELNFSDRDADQF